MVGTNDKSSQIARVTWLGLVVDIGLSIVKILFGLAGRSRALIADGLHSFSDMATDVIILFGVKVWSAPADENHPYGHQRIETLVSAGIGLFLCLMALGIGAEALSGLRDGKQTQPTAMALVGALLSIVLKEALFQITYRTGRRVKSAALVANAWHHRSDALSSVASSVAIVAALAGSQWAFIDGIGALVVALILLQAAWSIISPAFAVLADQGASAKVREEIMALAMEVKGVKAAHAIRTRYTGEGWYIDLHILVRAEMTVSKGHEISTQVKQHLLNQGPDIIDVVVHLEPYEPAQDETLLAQLQQTGGDDR